MESTITQAEFIAALWFALLFGAAAIWAIFQIPRTGRANYPDGSQEKYDSWDES